MSEKTLVSLSRLKAWEEASALIRTALTTASGLETPGLRLAHDLVPGLRLAFDLVEDERLVASRWHQIVCQSANSPEVPGE